MRQTLAIRGFETPGRGLLDITTPDVQSWVRQTAARIAEHRREGQGRSIVAPMLRE